MLCFANLHALTIVRTWPRKVPSTSMDHRSQTNTEAVISMTKLSIVICESASSRHQKRLHLLRKFEGLSWL